MARHDDVHDFYTFGKEIGRGGFSVVVEGAKKGTEEKYAIKCIKKSSIEGDDIKLLTREIQIMKNVRHDNILKLFEVFEDDDQFFLVMELVPGKELFDKIVERGQYSEKDASNIARQIISAVEYLHEKGKNFSSLPKQRVPKKFSLLKKLKKKELLTEILSQKISFQVETTRLKSLKSQTLDSPKTLMRTNSKQVAEGGKKFFFINQVFFFWLTIFL